MTNPNKNPKKYPNLKIESEIILDPSGKYTRTNSLVKNQAGHKRLMKTVINPVTNQKLTIFYAKGSFDEFCVPIEAYNLKTNLHINSYYFKDGEALTYLQELLKQPNITKKILFKDLYTIYKHVQKEYIDNQFLHNGIDTLVQKYQDKSVQAAANILYSYYQLSMTSEFYFINKNTGAKGALDGNIKMLSIIKMLQEKLSPTQAANYCHSKNRYNLKTEAEDYLKQLSQQNYLKNVKGD